MTVLLNKDDFCLYDKELVDEKMFGNVSKKKGKFIISSDSYANEHDTDQQINLILVNDQGYLRSWLLRPAPFIRREIASHDSNTSTGPVSI